MASGEYILDNIPARTYTITASKPGYIPQSFTTILSEEALTTIDFQLTEKEVPPEEPTTSHLPLLLIAAACIIIIALILIYKK